MVYGCLVSSTDSQLVHGAYRFLHPGLSTALPPDGEEKAGAESPHPLGEGPLFRGTQTEVRWLGATVTDLGVDVELHFEDRVFVDHVLLFGSAGAPAGVDSVDVLVRETPDAPLRPAGRALAGVGAAGKAGPLSVTVGMPAQAVRLHLATSFRDVVLGGIQVWGSRDKLPGVYPVADVMEQSDPQRLAVDGARITWDGSDATGDAAFAASFLSEGIQRMCGPSDETGPEIHLVRTEGPSAEPGVGGRMLHDTRRHFRDPRSPTDAAAEEDFGIEIGATGVRIRSASRRGLLYGVSAFLQLVGTTDGSHSVPHGSVSDGPATTLRGIHVGLPPREEIPFFKRLVRHLVVPFRYNTVFLEFAAGMAFRRHPEINAAWEQANRDADEGARPPVPHGEMVAGGSFLSQDEVADLVAFMKSFDLEVIPEIQSLSHVQYLTLSHPEIAEIPESAAGSGVVDLAEDDARPEGTAYHCYCAADDRARQLVKDMMDEILDVVQPERYVHLGHDEVYEIGTCPRCKLRDKAELFRTDVLALDAHVRSRGLRSMIWADMLQPPRRYGTEGAIADLPKDIVLLDFVWYFYLDDDIEDHLLEHGFTVVMGNLYSSHYPRFARRIRKPGMAGGQVSTWCRVDEHTLAAKGKLYDFLYTAEMLWDRRYDPRLRWSVDRWIQALLPDVRRCLSDRPDPRDAPGARLEHVDLAASTRAHAAPSSLSAALPERISIRGVSHPLARPPVTVAAPANVFDLPTLARIPLAAAATGLYFVHSCGASYTPMRVVGNYVVRYADGDDSVIPIEYGHTIADARRRYDAPLAHPAYRHFGYVATYTPDPVFQGSDAEGTNLTLYGFAWRNPRPKEPVAEVVLEATDTYIAVPIQLWALSIIRV